MSDKQRVLFLVTRALCSHVLDTVLYNYYCLYGGCQEEGRILVSSPLLAIYFKVIRFVFRLNYT